MCEYLSGNWPLDCVYLWPLCHRPPNCLDPIPCLWIPFLKKGRSLISRESYTRRELPNSNCKSFFYQLMLSVGLYNDPSLMTPCTSKRREILKIWLQTVMPHTMYGKQTWECAGMPSITSQHPYIKSSLDGSHWRKGLKGNDSCIHWMFLQCWIEAFPGMTSIKMESCRR